MKLILGKGFINDSILRPRSSKLKAFQTFPDEFNPNHLNRNADKIPCGRNGASTMIALVSEQGIPDCSQHRLTAML